METSPGQRNCYYIQINCNCFSYGYIYIYVSTTRPFFQSIVEPSSFKEMGTTDYDNNESCEEECHKATRKFRHTSRMWKQLSYTGLKNTHAIPVSMTVNFDPTDSKFVPSSEWAMAEQGSGSHWSQWHEVNDGSSCSVPCQWVTPSTAHKCWHHGVK